MTSLTPQQTDVHKVVIVGGGFGGLYAAQALRRAPVQVTVVDRRNFHLFQPLLYQVATGGISPGDIASPLRAILARQRNAQVMQAEVVDIDPQQRLVLLHDGVVPYDTLILAAGVRHHYFGHEAWEEQAPGLKTIEEALEIRRRVFLAFEAAERAAQQGADAGASVPWMTFVVVGGGPTGVELAGALGELAHRTLRDDFRHIDPQQVRIFLLEGQARILPTYHPDSSARAARALQNLGVTIWPNTLLTGITDTGVTVQRGDATQTLPARTLLWAAGVKASPLGRVLAQRTGVALDAAGRVRVQPDLSLPGFPEILVIGDLAHLPAADSAPLPGIAPVAMQQGRYAARLIQARLQGQSGPPFRYRDKGNLAVIGRNRAVAEIAGWRLSGLPAWLIWVFVHIAYLIGFDNKLLVLVQWAVDYLTRKRGARLITGDDPFPLIESSDAPEV